MPLRRVGIQYRHMLLAWMGLFTGITFGILSELQDTTDRNRVLAVEGREAHDAICALRSDLETRVANSRKFLADIKAKRRDPIPGITNQDIQTGINNQQRTIDSLSTLDCTEGEP